MSRATLADRRTEHGAHWHLMRFERVPRRVIDGEVFSDHQVRMLHPTSSAALAHPLCPLIGTHQ
jgi:hypothetical protein